MKNPTYRIKNVDQMDPFLMSLTSSDNHWMFISSNGALTAGREKADHSLFPYITDNLIHNSLNTTGPKTKIEIAVSDDSVDEVMKVIIDNAKSGKVGDGKIFISSI